MKSNPRTKAEAIASVVAYLSRYSITQDDLINIGGEDLEEPRFAAKARRVEKCSALMASLKVIFADLEAATGETTAERPSTRRGEGVLLEAIENIEENPIQPQKAKPLKTNDNQDNAPIEASEKRSAAARKRWAHKRKLKDAA